MGLIDLLFGKKGAGNNRALTPQERLDEAKFGLQEKEGCITCNFCDYFDRDSFFCKRLSVSFGDDFESSDYYCKYLNTSEFDRIFNDAVKVLDKE